MTSSSGILRLCSRGAPALLLACCILAALGGSRQSGNRSHSITLAWENDILTIHHAGIPGGKIDTWYLEAYCRAGSTDRKWEDTLISHRTKLVSINRDRTVLKLRCSLSDGVTVDHVLRAVQDGVTIEVIARNNTGTASAAHWAQPCTRVGTFTGTGASATEDKYAYLKRSFIFQDGDEEPDFMPTEDWSMKARYVPGQVWCPAGVPRTDVNPRPLNPKAPSLGLIGCVSADDKWILAMAWEPYQELFQGVIRCLHSDFRIGGLAPGEEKVIRGRFYLIPRDFPSLLARYKKDFPKHSIP
tara:strand:+ start:129 stop:1028 length:900 start_codon:yes stop_codon:yes gene_type:complete